MSTTSELLTELYQLSRTVEKMQEMAERDGCLHPATMNELACQWLRTHMTNDRVYQKMIELRDQLPPAVS